MPTSELHKRLQTAIGDRSFRQVSDLTGTHSETVRRYVHGATPSIEFALALSSALGVRVEWLLLGTGPMLQLHAADHLVRQATLSELFRALAHRFEEMEGRLTSVERQLASQALQSPAQVVEATP